MPDDIIKLIGASEHGKTKLVLKDMGLVCPSCKTKVKYINKSDGSKASVTD